MVFRGWIFDIYPGANGLVVWTIDSAGLRRRWKHPYTASFYASGSRENLRHLVRRLSSTGVSFLPGTAEKKDFWSGRSQRVLKITTSDLFGYPRLVRAATELEDRLGLFNCDIPIPQLFFYETGLFPLAWCRFHADGDTIQGIDLEDDPWALDYRMPPLTILEVRQEGELIDPKFRTRQPLEIVFEGQHHVIDAATGAEAVETFDQFLRKYDPDVIVSWWGDSAILPRLHAAARRARIPLALNRDRERESRRSKDRSYFSYGKIIFTSGSHLLYGRWHIDFKNSFIVRETGLEGLIELARLSKIPVQRLARTSTGTAITSMELDVATQDGALIPWRKRHPEDFKSGLDLLLIDKGGLVYQPKLGLWEQVGELDFSSMYPSLMARFNISPETINCACCPHRRVPEIGYHTCEHRVGLVTRTLQPILSRREVLKRLKAEAPNEDLREAYDRRQNALKWMLVTSFGYLGYRNARFGRIEAHEAVTAYGREKLLQAKEIAEAAGFELLHAIVDSMWLRKPGAALSDYEALARRISQVAEIPIAVEGIYNWIVFLPSRVSAQVPVVNRYFGVFRDGKLKVRGLEVRRHDMPRFIQDSQQAMIDVVMPAASRSEYLASVPRVLDVLLEAYLRLAGQRVALSDLVITKHLSQSPGQYQKASLTAIVAGELLHRGIHLNAGEAIQYIIVNAKDPERNSRAKAYPPLDGSISYDVAKYVEFLLKAAEAVLLPAGISTESLSKWITAKAQIRQPWADTRGNFISTSLGLACSLSPTQGLRRNPG